MLRVEILAGRSGGAQKPAIVVFAKFEGKYRSVGRNKPC